VEIRGGGLSAKASAPGDRPGERENVSIELRRKKGGQGEKNREQGGHKRALESRILRKS